MYSASDIASYTVEYCRDQNIKITHLRLHLFLYFVQGEYCRATGNRFISEDFYIWSIGAYIPELYRYYSVFAGLPIQNTKCKTKINPKDKSFIQYILQKYAMFSTCGLVDKCKQEDPWHYNYMLFGKNALIPYESIKNYYRQKNEEEGEINGIM
jgi:uncharacterized phage-associated protein